MRYLPLLIKVFPFGAFLYYGVKSILQALIPSMRDPDFNRWEIDEGTGDYIEIFGWRKVLRTPHVIAQGYMSDGAASAVAIIVGVICIVIGIIGIRHFTGVPAFIHDPFESS
jgi:hypothetical protein